MKRTAGFLMLLVALFLVSALAVAEGAYPSNGLALEATTFIGTKIIGKEEVTGLIPGEIVAADAVESIPALINVVQQDAVVWADGGLEPGSIYLERLSTNYIRSPTAA
jgi:hypothetical protein